MSLSRKNNHNAEKLTILIVLATASTLFSMVSLFFNNSDTQIKKALVEMEAFKVGGIENWNKLQSLYNNPQFASQQAQNIDAAIASFGGPAAPTPSAPDTTAQPAAANTLTPAQLESVLANTFIKGNKDSDIILIEYSDFECPFCQRHFENKTVETLIANNNISTTFKNFPLNFHPNAQKSAEGGLCIGNALGEDKFFDYVDQVFASKDPSINNITMIAKGLGMKEAEFTSCLNDNTYAAQVANEMNEGQQLFGVNGTPGNVLLNKTTGKFIVVSGAQPATAFESAIQQLQ